jgi:hypothetical protein
MRRFIAYLCALILCAAHVSALAITPKIGTWWNTAESGRGYTIDGMGDTLMLGAFVYDANGYPVWYLAVGKLTNNGANWSATLDKTQNGQCLSCGYKAPISMGNDGTVSIIFSSDTKGVMTLPNGSKINIETFFPLGSAPNVSGNALAFPIDFKGIRMDALTYTTDTSGRCKAALTFTNTGGNALQPFLYFDILVGNIAVRQTIFNFSIMAGTTATVTNSIYDSATNALACGSFTMRFNDTASAVY